MASPTAILTAAQMRAAEQQIFDSGISPDALMARAGQGAAEWIWRIGGKTATLVVCGPGNNGGDGYVIAQRLQEKGVPVTVCAFAPPKTETARNAAKLWTGQTVSVDTVRPATQLVDCLFGTGLSRALPKEWQTLLMRLHNEAHRSFAVDLPSGIEADEGRIWGAVPSYDLTIALGAFKPSHFLQPAAQHMGQVVRVDLGIMTKSDCHLLDRPELAGPGADDHKYRRGLVAVVAGEMSGAARLAAMAAQAGGAGYVRLLGASAPHDSIVSLPIVSVHDLETQLSDARIGCILIGPGLGRSDRARALLDAVVATGKPLVIDADALVLLGSKVARRLSAHAAPAIITPHGGEVDALDGGDNRPLIHRAKTLSEATGAVVIAKSANSIIAAPDGTTSLSHTASSWLSTAGTGDVLAGVVAARLAVTGEAMPAACQGQWLHSRAARLAGPLLVPEDLIAQLPHAFAECLAS